MTDSADKRRCVCGRHSEGLVEAEGKLLCGMRCLVAQSEGRLSTRMAHADLIDRLERAEGAAHRLDSEVLQLRALLREAEAAQVSLLLVFRSIKDALIRGAPQDGELPMLREIYRIVDGSAKTLTDGAQILLADRDRLASENAALKERVRGLEAGLTCAIRAAWDGPEIAVGTGCVESYSQWCLRMEFEARAALSPPKGSAHGDE